MGPTKSTGKRAGSSAPTSLHRQLRPHWRALIMQLQLAQSTITLAALILREQNADADADIALLLQRCAGDALRTGIERLEALVMQGEAA